MVMHLNVPQTGFVQNLLSLNVLEFENKICPALVLWVFFNF